MEPTPVGCIVNGALPSAVNAGIVNGRVNKAACIRN